MSSDSASQENGRVRLVLFQAREPHDPMREHEVDCFLRHLGVALEALEIYSLLDEPVETLYALLDDPRVRIFIGGSGDYSISSGGPPNLERFVYEGIPRLVERGLPTFGSCWGLHALVAGLGGKVDYTGHSEVGTFEVRLTNGHRDPLFSSMPTKFSAQMGHKDWVLELPEAAVSLCENDMSPYQAVRFGDGPIYGLQFHAELSLDDNRARFLHYINNYGAPGEDAELQLSTFQPSPHANTLLRRFLDLYCANGTEAPSRDAGE